MKRIAWVLLSVSAFVSAQTGEEIMDMVIAKQSENFNGGDLQSMVTTATLNAPNGLSGKITTYSKAGGKIFIKTLINMGSQEIVSKQGCDGVDCYDDNPMIGQRLLQGDEKVQLLTQNRLAGYTDWRASFASAELLGSEMIEDRDCFKVKLTTEQGLEMVNYVDKESHQVVKIDMTIDSPNMGQVNSEMFPTNYKDYQGMILPSTMTMKMMQQEMSIDIDSYEFNVEIPDKKFEVPDTLKETAQ